MLTANIEDGPRGPSSKLSLAGFFLCFRPCFGCHDLGVLDKVVLFPNIALQIAN